jgi:hypothetical protein
VKVSVLLAIARQLEGEMVFVNAVKAHISSDKLHRYLRENDLPRTKQMDGIDCVIEYGVLEDIEIEENNEQTSV